MFREISSIEDDQLLDFDVCIVGAGAAGISMSLSLADGPLRVALIEGGGDEFDSASQDIYAGEVDGYYDLDITRLRYLGGSTNHWTNYCRRPDQSDLSARDWNKQLGWPITMSDFEAYIPRAAELCGVRDQFDWQNWAEELGITPSTLADDDLATGFDLIGPGVRFGDEYRTPIETSKHVNCFLNTNCIEFIEDDLSPTVRTARFKTLDGKQFTIAAKAFVLACGGIENPRMLLNSRKKSQSGIGNQYDQVGRYFSDHRLIDLGLATMSRSNLGIEMFRTWKITDDLRLDPLIQTTRSFNDARGHGRTILRMARREENASFAHKLRLRFPSIFMTDGYLDEQLNYSVTSFAEPYPDADNRITLIDQIDSTGMQKIRLTYRFNELEDQAHLAAAEKLGGVLASSKAGLFQQTYDPADPETAFVVFGNHHYSTTRMSAEPQTGVVDQNCRVHNMNNFYVCGTSTFSSGGMMSPTMTLISLALRLADRLKREL